jgi:hypothetical protein
VIRLSGLLGIAVLAACSSFPDVGNGVVALEISTPDTVNGAGCTSPSACTLPARDSLTFRARALNLQGDSVAAEIIWSTPDTALIAVDALRGVVTAKSDTGGTARVQASVSTLRSNLISVRLLRDTTTAAGQYGRQ